MTKPIKYEYWFVGYVSNNQDYHFGRVEVTKSDSESPWADYEISIKIPADSIDASELCEFIDSLETDDPIKTQEELLKLYNERDK